MAVCVLATLKSLTLPPVPCMPSSATTWNRNISGCSGRHSPCSPERMVEMCDDETRSLYFPHYGQVEALHEDEQILTI